MTSQVHPSSYLSPTVKIGKNVNIGPFCNIDGNIEISDNTILKSHISISGNTVIGKNNTIYPFSNIGCDPQDLKFNGEDSFLTIGDNNIIRESVTVSKGTKDGGMYTTIGNGNLLMTGVHIAHDCNIGSHNIFVNQVTLGGHVRIMSNAVIGGLSAIIQFVTIGSYSMIGGMSGIDKNVLPFSLALGNRAKLRGLNLVGIRRGNFSKDDIQRIREYHDFKNEKNLKINLNHKIDQFFDEYNNMINEKLGHIK
jgi:UDP-N-acetylglucosamine acyltransferase